MIENDHNSWEIPSLHSEPRSQAYYVIGVSFRDEVKPVSCSFYIK